MFGASQTDDRYIFLVEWFDEHSTLYRAFYLSFYIQDGSIELVSTRWAITLTCLGGNQEPKSVPEKNEIPLAQHQSILRWCQSENIFTIVHNQRVW